MKHKLIIKIIITVLRNAASLFLPANKFFFFLIPKQAIEKRIKENEEKFHETEKEYKNLIKTTQKNENQYERKIKDFQNKISFIIENLSKNLENLDSLVLSEQLNDVKQKRRDLVKNIQNIITKCDSLDEEFANYNKKS